MDSPGRSDGQQVRQPPGCTLLTNTGSPGKFSAKFPARATIVRPNGGGYTTFGWAEGRVRGCGSTWSCESQPACGWTGNPMLCAKTIVG